MKPSFASLTLDAPPLDGGTKQFKKELTKERHLYSYAEAASDSLEDVRLLPAYFAEDIAGKDAHLDQFPGFAPHMRGPYSTMYRIKPWTIHQHDGAPSVAATNLIYREAIRCGATSVTCLFDKATHKGRDSDHPALDMDDTGLDGMAASTLDDWQELFDGIDFTRVQVSLHMNSAALPVMGFLLAAAERKGVSPAQIKGTITNDILSEFICGLRQIHPLQAAMQIHTDIIKYVAKKMPGFHPVSIDGYLLREAGATVDLEIAYAMANALEYVRSALAAGLPFESFVPRFSFTFGIGANLCVEIAKLRAARLLWAKLMQPYCAADQRPPALKAHCRTLSYALGDGHPHDNLSRATISALAAVLGGTQSLHVATWDECFKRRDPDISHDGARIQHILQKETALTSIIDPLGGSYAIETLTYDIARQAYDHLLAIEEAGGMRGAIELGIPTMRIKEAASRRQERLDNGLDGRAARETRRQTSGELPQEDTARTARKTSGLGAERKEQLKAYRAKRDNKAWTAALQRLSTRARAGDGLLVEECLASIRAGATHGEICETLVGTFGRFRASIRPILGIDSAQVGSDDDFRQGRAAADHFARNYGIRPRVCLSRFGGGYDRLLKAISLAFAGLGFDVDIGGESSDPRLLARMAVENDVHVIGVSFLTSDYHAFVPELIAHLKDYGRSDILVVAGGVFSQQDYEWLCGEGVFAVFGPGTVIADCAMQILKAIDKEEANQ